VPSPASQAKSNRGRTLAPGSHAPLTGHLLPDLDRASGRRCQGVLGRHRTGTDQHRRFVDGPATGIEPTQPGSAYDLDVGDRQIPDAVEQLVVVAAVDLGEPLGLAAHVLKERFGHSAHPFFPGKGPFTAVQVVPGDLGTKGGVLTDDHARVLDTDGAVIEGLYAAGNTSASVMGRTYPGPGATIGPATVFGYRAARHAAVRRARAALRTP
jgi:hypothetical protein